MHADISLFPSFNPALHMMLCGSGEERTGRVAAHVSRLEQLHTGNDR